MVVPTALADRVGPLLFALGSCGLETQDAETLRFGRPEFALPPGYLRVIAYFDAEQNAESAVASVAQALARDGVSWHREHPPAVDIENVDWLERWKRFFTVQHVSDRICVVPAWLEAPSPEPTHVVRINPGAAFGSGTHESTQLALTLVDQVLLSRPGTRTLLDVGCGSGILSILAAKCGVGQVLGIDSDHGVFDNAGENLALNGVASSVSVSDRPLERLTDQFDVVVANIIAPILVSIAAALVPRVADGGMLVLSGLLETQVAEVMSAYSEQGMETVETVARNEWRGLLCQRRAG